MASITGITNSDPTNPGGSSGSPVTAAAAKDPLAQQSTFLTLLVSQLKNQNPSSPMDGTTFVTQLAQFSNLQQTLAMRQDMDTISAKYAGKSSLDAPAASPATNDSKKTS